MSVWKGNYCRWLSLLVDQLIDHELPLTWPSSFPKTAAFNTPGRHQLGRAWNILNMDGSYWLYTASILKQTLAQEWITSLYCNKITTFINNTFSYTLLKLFACNYKIIPELIYFQYFIYLFKCPNKDFRFCQIIWFSVWTCHPNLQHTNIWELNYLRRHSCSVAIR